MKMAVAITIAGSQARYFLIFVRITPYGWIFCWFLVYHSFVRQTSNSVSVFQQFESGRNGVNTWV
jgi:hypothetical protein